MKMVTHREKDAGDLMFLRAMVPGARERNHPTHGGGSLNLKQISVAIGSVSNGNCS